MRAVVLSTAAATDLTAIQDYLSAQSERAAERTVGAILDTMANLASQPDAGHSRRDVPGHLRCTVVFSYVIV